MIEFLLRRRKQFSPSPFHKRLVVGRSCCSLLLHCFLATCPSQPPGCHSTGLYAAFGLCNAQAVLETRQAQFKAETEPEAFSSRSFSGRRAASLNIHSASEHAFASWWLLTVDLA